ncbi:hypothetical protein SCR11_13510, partial [Legionella pneumophila serogroup 1]
YIVVNPYLSQFFIEFFNLFCRERATRTIKNQRQTPCVSCERIGFIYIANKKATSNIFGSHFHWIKLDFVLC